MAATISAQFERMRLSPSDINEHLPTLRKYAMDCTTIAECGVRSIVSTWALLDGLLVNPGPRRLICVDIAPVPEISGVAEIARAAGVQLEFQQIDSVYADLGDGVDMLFIDTWHVYGHLRRELAAHQAKVRRYIAMHDTTVDGERGESRRCGHNLVEMAASSGYSVEDVGNGLGRAIKEFLADHPEWAIDSVYINNNGLTVLRRVA
jgi:hypothetical protein